MQTTYLFIFAVLHTYIHFFYFFHCCRCFTFTKKLCSSFCFFYHRLLARNFSAAAVRMKTRKKVKITNYVKNTHTPKGRERDWERGRTRESWMLALWLFNPFPLLCDELLLNVFEYNFKVRPFWKWHGRMKKKYTQQRNISIVHVHFFEEIEVSRS